MKKGKLISELAGTGTRALIMGCACVIRSRLTPEQIEKFCIYHPEALELKDEDGEVLFSIDVGDGGGCLTQEGALFSRVTTADGKATITILTDPECENRREAVLGTVGPGLALLDVLEDRLLAMLPDLEQEAEKAWDSFAQLWFDARD